MTTTKHERFMKIAAARTNAVLERLRMLARCAYTHENGYTEEDVTRIFDAIAAEMDKTETRFREKMTKQEEFTL